MLHTTYLETDLKIGQWMRKPGMLLQGTGEQLINEVTYQIY